MKSGNQVKAAYLAAASQAIIIGLSFLFVKMTLNQASPMDVLAHRMTIGFISAILPVLAGKAKIRITWRDVPKLIPAALAFPVFVYTFQTYSLQTLPSTEAGIIQALTPIFAVILAAIFLGERSTLGQVAFVCLSVFGVIFMLVMKGVSLEAFDGPGTIMMVVSVLCSALYVIQARRLTKQMPWYNLSVFVQGFGALVFNVIAVGTHLSQGTLGQYYEPFTLPGFALSIIYLGAFSSYGANVLSNFALARLESSRMTVFNNLSMVVTVVAGVLILGEALHWYHIAGALIIVAGIYGTNKFRNRTPKSQAVSGGKDT